MQVKKKARGEGIDLMAKLMKILLDEKRFEDAAKASNDAECRMKEYKLIE